MVPDRAARVRIEEQWHATDDPDISLWALRYEVSFANDHPPETFERSHLLRRHAPEHFQRRLAAAGFKRICSTRGYAEMPSDDPSDDLIFLAQRPN
jgi:hypothetical protein